MTMPYRSPSQAAYEAVRAERQAILPRIMRNTPTQLERVRASIVARNAETLVRGVAIAIADERERDSLAGVLRTVLNVPVWAMASGAELLATWGDARAAVVLFEGDAIESAALVRVLPPAVRIVMWGDASAPVTRPHARFARWQPARAALRLCAAALLDFDAAT